MVRRNTRHNDHVTVTNVNGCSATATTTVVVNTLPVVNVSGTSPICAGNTSLLNGTSGGTSQWYLNGVLIPGATSNTYSATLPGVYNMIKTNLNGCFDSAAVGFTLVVNPLPTATANNTGPYCAGATIQLNSPSGSATDDAFPTARYAFVFRACASALYVVTLPFGT